MCNIIVINKGEKEIETPREFEKHFGYIPLRDEHYGSAKYTEEQMDYCLCQCDIDETFKRLGIKYKTDAGDYYVGQLDLVKGDDEQ